jgi:uncharacterized membrane protein YgdD (TMEM256/DUF423 family)
MNKTILVSGIVFAMLGVVLGAFAAHGLKSKISTEMIAVFQTGVQYQFYHGLGLILLALLGTQISSTLLPWAGWSMIAEVVCFSGSLYALALTGIKWFGPITPLGGLFFIIGWLVMLVAVVREG